jgi:hypothetical protein
MAIAAGMVVVLHLLALRASSDLPAERFGAALLNGPHHPAMAGQKTVTVARPVSGAVVSENIGQL